ncbi:MAG: glycosyltransferase [Rhodospirillales bacterium]|nr:glycosyltransferase [Rhodospirillales bacterium]
MQKRRLRILVNAIHARSGGGLTYLRHLLPLLAAEPDLEIHIVPHPTQDSFFASLSPALFVHRLTMPSGWLQLLLWEQFSFPLQARRIGYDAVLSPANFGPLAIRRQVIVIQNAVTVGARERRLAKKLYWITLRLMTLISLAVVRRAVAVSHYAATTARSRLPPQTAADIVHHGVDPAFVPGTQPRQDFLLAVGDLYVQKNLHGLVEAMVLVRHEKPSIRLRIAGEAIDRDYAALLRKLVAERGLADCVDFLGRRPPEELIVLYQTCAIFVFPSTEESFGMPLVEAMACGAPIVASMSAATPEIAGDAALLCDAEAPYALAQAIVRILDDATLRNDLQRRAIARARDFSWPDCARRTAAILRDAAAAG